MALDNVTSHFSTMLEPIASASFLSSLSIIHALHIAQCMGICNSLYNSTTLRIHLCRCATLQIANFQTQLGVKFGVMLNILMSI